MYIKKCNNCNNETIQIKSIINNPFNRSQRVIATYNECFKCNERVFSEEETRRLKQLAKDNKIIICRATNEECSDCTYSCEHKLIKNKGDK